ncbi:MAG: aminotransferase class V-fold PLP-dependent enzyme, partial [Bacteroidota bacterium]
EALDTIIFGLDLDRNDEVVACKQDYPLMIHAWNQRSQREGIELKWVDLKMPIEDEDAIIQAYTSLFTHRTKVVHLTHMINWTGQILPVKKIAAIAKERGIKVVVDAAHSFAQLDFKLADLGADYAGVSLHKWLCAPFGTGMLYVKKENIADLWPLFPTDKPKSDDIRKFENLGTRSTAAEMAIGHAIEFHELIGASRKAARLQYLKSYWVEKALEIPQFRLYTSLNPQYGGAIVCCGLEGMRYVDLFNNLLKYHRIHTSPVKWDGVEGLRITPNVYTSLKELDKLVEALKILADSVKR